MSEVLQVERREAYGKHLARRLRRSGKLPAVLYGHGEPSVSLSVPTDQVDAAIRRGAKVVELQGDAGGQALIQDLQWDVFSTHVMHLDLLRVEAGERITIEVPVELRGVAPGTNEGGVVEHLVHRLEIETDVSRVPERLHVNINGLEVDGSLSIAAIEDLPDGAKVLLDETTLIVQCVVPAVAPEEAEGEAAAAEPEVIGQKPSDEGEEDA
jgi:large subunit ribosomal protein L25